MSVFYNNYGTAITVIDITPKSVYLPKPDYFQIESDYWYLIDTINQKILPEYQTKNPKPPVSPYTGTWQATIANQAIIDWGAIRLKWLQWYLQDDKQYNEWVYWAQGQARSSTSYIDRVGSYIAPIAAAAVVIVGTGGLAAPTISAPEVVAPNIALSTFELPAIPTEVTSLVGAIGAAGSAIKDANSQIADLKKAVGISDDIADNKPPATQAPVPQLAQIKADESNAGLGGIALVIVLGLLAVKKFLF